MHPLAPAAIAVFCTLAAQALPDVVLRPGGNVTAPFVLAKPVAVYTEEARVARLEGSVLLSATISKGGQPMNIHVERPLGLGLDESAVANVRAWKFRPGSVDGQTAALSLEAEVFFRQKRRLEDWHLEGVNFEIPDGASRPVLVHAEFPPAGESEESVAVQVSLEIAKDGSVVRPQVEKSSETGSEGDVLRAIRAWRFRSAARDGKAVAVRAHFDFVRGSHSPIPLGKAPAGR